MSIKYRIALSPTAYAAERASSKLRTTSSKTSVSDIGPRKRLPRNRQAIEPRPKLAGRLRNLDDVGDLSGANPLRHFACLFLSLRLLQPRPRTAAVGVDELDPGGFKASSHHGERRPARLTQVGL